MCGVINNSANRAHFRRLLLTQTIPTVSWLPEMRLDVLSHRRNGVEMKLCPDDVPGCVAWSQTSRVVLCDFFRQIQACYVFSPARNRSMMFEVSPMIIISLFLLRPLKYIRGFFCAFCIEKKNRNLFMTIPPFQDFLCGIYYMRSVGEPLVSL